MGFSRSSFSFRSLLDGTLLINWNGRPSGLPFFCSRPLRQAERMTSLFFTKYSTPEYSVVRVMTQPQKPSIQVK